MKLYSASETRKIDGLAIKEKGITGYSLMQMAAEFSLDVILSEFNPVEELIIFCSKGKNSGDGFLLGSFAKEFGLEVTVVMSNTPNELKGASKKAFAEMKESKVKTISNKSIGKLKVSNKAVIVDALIGTGLKGNLRKNIKDSILALNKLGVKSPVVSLDIPSGVNPDTGDAGDICVYADITATFVAQKKGCFTSIGKKASGEVIYSDLEIPKRIFSAVASSSYVVDYEDSISRVVYREQDAHKGNFGHVLVIGGDRGMGGASLLSSRAAVYSGAGLTSLVTRPEHVIASLVSCPEVMVKGVDSGQDLEEHLVKPNVIAIGPGLGQSAWSEQMVQRVFWEAEKRDISVIMDADALNLLTTLKLSSNLPKKLILTPHPGEASRLLNTTVTEIESDRFSAAAKIQKKFNATVVLKGSGTIICNQSSGTQKWGICGSGNPGMATGGMGDVLTGIIAGILAQGLTLKDAAEAGVDLHAKAADQASLEFGEAGLTSSDVINELRYLLKYD
jgi:NAD(P)H-hydrate epimerase